MHLNSISLYFASVFIWGSTFFAIKFQLGDVAPEVSVAYRFALAAAILFLWGALRGLPLKFSFTQQVWMGLQGLFLFCLNYLLVYWATSDLSSGLVAVVFSTIILMNIVNGALFLGKKSSAVVIVGALFGLAGISLVFWPELVDLQEGSNTYRGLLLSLAGTFVASLGNIISARNQQNQIPVIQCNAYGMAYGALIMVLAATVQGLPFGYELSWGYSLSLGYLALFGSVLAFGSYLTLLGRIGPEKAAYTMILFPLVALVISTFFEGYQWSVSAALGVILVLAGNLLIVLPKSIVDRLLGRTVIIGSNCMER